MEVSDEQGFVFGLSPKYRAKAQAWIKEHPCTVKYGGAIGGTITYVIVPTSIGSWVNAKCACGAELKDITNAIDSL